MKSCIAFVILVIGATIASVPVSFIVQTMYVMSMVAHAPLSNLASILIYSIIPPAIGGWYGAKMALHFVPLLNKKAVLGAYALLVVVSYGLLIAKLANEPIDIIGYILSAVSLLFSSKSSLRRVPSSNP